MWFFCIRFLSTPIMHKPVRLSSLICLVQQVFHFEAAADIWHLQLVTRSSACLDGFGPQALDANHSGMNKFDGPDCTNFRRVKELIKRFADGASAAGERRMTPEEDPSLTR